ncbi:flagellar hook-basal body complex protein FliE [Paraburkholderia caballeronis]|uniref:Flagellar hook-basal body complex protein FliE n=1 Tax=Paraburkholderia caballeronis TaxID=416943 RepID=A0A1H7SK40_9BURK|nr:flagellar hook-basal body complex protein FliE [Paraburkholderia caballeronis]PXW22353.1 flagellar hook-basal body complex protein FliE [Paraburkholderia caballeronis]PXW96011.1 flagellar hook-basal body complex protein FliE [Paraburkholderia caballeronis]RAJ92377.1 flagellar hook-basal body complex protein FliE [Paraburkholderia caballeronis]TDV08078.1 flagellar hook-basal body complex protein FliE [Paraburkholderia caballeronis]TDV11858.1 flagellar hook-basal body complex protein FliE [Pa
MTIPVSPLASALAQMQAMSAQAAGSAAEASETSGAATAGGFAAALKASIDKISDDQKSAVNESQAFELGASNVSLNDVMVDMQKANIGFQFGLQVRNKLVSAYTDLMQTAV